MIAFASFEYIRSAQQSVAKIMAPIPDHPSGLRFCRKCAAHLPLGQFHAGVRRLECRIHALERAARYRKHSTPDAKKKVVARVWHAFWTDSRIVFGQKAVGLKQKDVRFLFELKGIDPDIKYRIVPKNPDAVWGVNNAEIVPKHIRRELASAFLKRSGEVEDVQMDHAV
jgi:hypothetical protein